MNKADLKHKDSWVDTHCHLEMLKEDPKGALERSREMGVKLFMTIGTKQASNQAILGHLEEYEGVWGALGIHPHEADHAQPEHLEFILEHSKSNPKLVAIGECGYDYYYGYSSRENQKRVFYRQLEMALELDLPLVIHSREAEEDTLTMLADFKGKGLRGVFHSFTSSKELAHEVLEAGFHLSFNGICTFPKSEDVREVLRMTPLDRLLLETDAPFLAPVPVRGKPNFPGNVAHVGHFIAEHLRMETEELRRQTTLNALRLFERVGEQ